MSCLFNSLAPAVNLHPEVLRKTIAGYLKTDPELLDNIKAKDIVAWTDGKDLNSYADNMARPGVWGGAIEIRAFCELFHMDVTVHVLYTNNKFVISSSKTCLRNIYI